MHGAHAALLQPTFDAEIEVGGIDADEDIRLPTQHPLAKLFAQTQQARQMRQYFGQAHHRQLAGIEPGVHARRTHGVATDTGELCIREMLPQCLDQAGAELVAGGFAGAKGDSHSFSFREKVARSAG